MTANDLRDMLISYCARNMGTNGDNVVAVKTVGRSPCDADCGLVTHLINGGDWNAGKLLLCPEDRLLKAPPTRKEGKTK